MHSYYAENKEKLKKGLSRFMQLVKPELEKAGSKPYPALLAEIWDYYEKNLLERFPYIGGDKVSGTRNLTGAYCFVAMGEVMKRYGASMEEIGSIMVLCYERYYLNMPGLIRKAMGTIYKRPQLMNRMLMKKDAKNAANTAKNTGS